MSLEQSGYKVSKAHGTCRAAGSLALSVVSLEDTKEQYLWFHCFTEGCLEETKKTSHWHYIT